MSDVMHGPSVLVGAHTKRKTYLLAFIDDATRVIPYCAFTLAENTRAFLPVLKQALTFAIMSIITILMAISLRRDLTPGWFGPYFPFLVWMLVPAGVTWLAVEWPLLQELTHTTGLTGKQWGAVIGLSILPSIVIEFEKTHRGALLRLSLLEK